jgi:hypothetical protein
MTLTVAPRYFSQTGADQQKAKAESHEGPIDQDNSSEIDC